MKKLEIFNATIYREPTAADYQNGEAYGFKTGYQYAMLAASEIIIDLKNMGYSRPAEIANILEEFSLTTIYNWREGGGDRHKPPGLPDIIKSWREMRKTILDEFDNKCCRCFSTERLEVDHINPVKDGGLPLKNNLRVLCKPCHQTRGQWES